MCVKWRMTYRSRIRVSIKYRPISIGLNSAFSVKCSTWRTKPSDVPIDIIPVGMPNKKGVALKATSQYPIINVDQHLLAWEKFSKGSWHRFREDFYPQSCPCRMAIRTTKMYKALLQKLAGANRFFPGELRKKGIAEDKCLVIKVIMYVFKFKEMNWV